MLRGTLRRLSLFGVQIRTVSSFHYRVVESPRYASDSVAAYVRSYAYLNHWQESMGEVEGERLDGPESLKRACQVLATCLLFRDDNVAV
jgi:hypothetical protein